MLQRITTQLKRVVGISGPESQQQTALRQTLADLEASAEELRRTREEHDQKAREWEAKATRATAAKQDDLAEIAVVRKGQFQESVQRIAGDLVALEAAIGDHRQMLAALGTSKGD